MTRLDIGEAIDILSRIIAHERTHKRGAVKFPEIAGSQVGCDNSDICNFLTDAIGERGSGNETISEYVGQLGNDLYFGSISPGVARQQLSYIQAAVDHITVEVNRTGETIGTPTSGETVFGDLEALKSQLQSVATNQANDESNYLIPTNDALPYPNSQATDVHADINRAIASILLGNALSDLIKDAVGTITDPIGTLLQTIQIAFPKAAGGTEVINYNTQLLASGEPPPITDLTFGTALSLGTGANVAIPAGTYGYAFNFTVPDYWGSRGFFAEDKTPSIAVLDWRYNAYSFDNPKYIRKEDFLAFPLHPAANRFTVDLAPGVTGTYTPLTL